MRTVLGCFGYMCLFFLLLGVLAYSALNGNYVLLLAYAGFVLTLAWIFRGENRR